MFEGIGKYIFALFVIYFIAYIVKKIELSKIFKKANRKPSKAFIPFVCTKELIEISHADTKLFKKTLIPFVRISAYINIYREMVKTFGGNPDDAIYYYIFPMVYFTRLGSGPARVEIHDYDINNEYLQNQSILYEPVTGEEEKPLYDMTDPGYYVEPTNKEQFVYKVERKNNTADSITIKANDPIPVQNERVFDVNSLGRPNVSESIPEVEKVNNFEVDTNNSSIFDKEENSKSNSVEPTISMDGPKSVFTDSGLEPDKRHEKVVEVQKQEEVVKKPIQENITGRPQMCPKCGAKLAPGATVCFLCGNKLS